MPVGIPRKAVTQSSRTVAAAGNYDAGDVVSNSATDTAGTPWVFSGTGRHGRIQDAMYTSSEDSVTWRLRMHLYQTDDLTQELDDNAAMSITEADRAYYLGYIDFPAAADEGGVATSSVGVLSKGYFAPDGVLYGVLETLDAEANEASGMTLSFTLFIEK